MGTKLFLSFVVFGLLGCASVNSVSLTPIPSNRAKQVRAEVSKVIILGFSFDNDFIDPLVSDLKNQCPNGVVSGILTKDETISYLLVFKKRVIATGFCSQVGKKTASKNRKRIPSADENSELTEMEE